MNERISHRDLYWDSLKGFLIILVVVGHFIKSSHGFLPEGSVAWIYSFHMPLFMFISGYFTNSEKSWNKLIGRLSEPLLVFTIILLLCPFNFHWYNFPCGASWYLFVLIIYRSGLKLYHKYIGSKLVPLIIVSFILGIIINILPHTRIMSIDRCFYFAPFFLLGTYVKQKQACLDIIQGGKNSIWPIRIGLLLLFLLIMCLLPFRTELFWLFEAKYKASDIITSRLAFVVIRIICYIVSLIICVLVLKSIKPNKILVSLGQYSLGIYVWHYVLVCCFRLFNEHLCLPQEMWFTLPLSIVVIFVSYLFSKTEVSQLILNPITAIAKKQKNK